MDKEFKDLFKLSKTEWFWLVWSIIVDLALLGFLTYVLIIKNGNI